VLEALCAQKSENLKALICFCSKTVEKSSGISGWRLIRSLATLAFSRTISFEALMSTRFLAKVMTTLSALRLPPAHSVWFSFWPHNDIFSFTPAASAFRVVLILATQLGIRLGRTAAWDGHNDKMYISLPPGYD